MCDLTKSDIEEIIDEGLNNKESLVNITDKLKSITDYLSDYDNVFIEAKYCELLIDRWLVESGECMKDSTNPHQLLETIKAIKSVGNLSDCCKLIGNSAYNIIVKDLNDSKLLKPLERKCIHRFKETCLDAISIQTSTISSEIAFVEECIELFKTSKDPTEIRSDIRISDFLNGDDVNIDFRNFLQNLKTCRDNERKYAKIKQLGYDLLKEDNFYLSQGLKDTVNSYFEPVIISETFADGRIVLEVSGKYIILSRIVTEVEQQPRFSRIEEVRFVCSDVIHVDVDFLAIWHGKNVVVHANSIIVSKNHCVWNVSGNDGKETNALREVEVVESCKSVVTQENSGESGGNVMIIANHLKGGENLQIISNGGNGSKGLDGRKGDDGIDGEAIDDSKFKELYPPVSLFKNSGKNTNLKKTHENILYCLKSVDCLYYNNVNYTSMEANQMFHEGAHFEDSKNINSLYFEVTTNTGSKILFSFHNETFAFCQSFLLYKGAVGTEGKPGLNGGRGGTGGFGGKIDVFVTSDNSLKILKCSFQGQTGSTGKDGTRGKPGKYGLDKAYMDCTLTCFGEEWPKFFFPQESDDFTLAVQYSDDENFGNSKKVFAPHKSKYAEITRTRREYRRSNIAERETLETVQNIFKEKSCRKKTISLESIIETYGKNESILNISELSEYVGNAMAAVLDNSGEEALDIEQNSEEVSVTRKILFESDYFASTDWLTSLAAVSHIELESKRISKDSTLLLKQIQHNSNDLITLTNLAFVRLSLEQLNILWTILDQANCNQSVELNIKNLKTLFFCDKYKLAVLEHLQLNDFDTGLALGKYTDLIANTNIRFTTGLVVKKQKFGRVASFFVEDSPGKREEVLQICENFAVDKCVKTSIKTFLQEFGNSITMLNKSKELLNKNLDFEQMKFDQLQQTLELFKDELLQSKNRKLHQLLVKSIIEVNGKDLAQFLTEINSLKLNLECGLLKKLFGHYLKVIKNKYAWIGLEDKQGNVDSDIRLAFFDCITHIGINSRCYRDLLAFHFDVNIVIYTLNESRELVIIHNHNNKSSEKLLLLKEGNLYSEVELNKELAQMITAQISKGKTYSQVMLQIDSITDKIHFDNFISNALSKTKSNGDIDKSTRIATRVLNIISQDEDVKLITNAFVLLHERTMLCTRLEKLKLEYSGNESILHFMALHFKTEVNIVSAKELCFIINIILKYTSENNIMPLVSWIIAAFPHSSWLSELTLLKIEAYLKKTLEPDQKLRWREYLTKQNDSETLMLLHEKIDDNEDLYMSMEQVEEVLCLISAIPRAFVGLAEVSILEWKYYLKDRYWLYKVKNSTINWTEDEIKLISYYLLLLENKKGTPFCNKILSIMDANKQNLTESAKLALEDTLRFLSGDENFIDNNIADRFSECPISKWPLLWKCSTYHADQYRTGEELVNLIKSSGNTTEHVLTSLDNIVDTLREVNSLLKVLKEKIRHISQLSPCVEQVLAHILRVDSAQKYTKKDLQFKNDQYYCNVIELLNKSCIKFNIGVDQNTNNERDELNINTEDLNRILVALVIFSVNILLEKELRETQKLAILTFLQSGKNILGQIATGEGKSLIVVCIAIIKVVLSGHSVDVLTSSNVLAQRDAEDYKKVYTMFHVGVGNNCSQNIEDRKKAYSNCKVVYGELASFQRDYLLDRFYSKNILGDRKFELIIVDEVDSMLLDQSDNILYLSHEIPGVDKLEPVFVFIWKWLNMPGPQEEMSMTISSLKDAIEFDIFGVIKLDNIRDLDLNLTESQLVSTWEYLINERVIDRNGHLLVEYVDESKVTVKDRPKCIPENHFRYLLKNVVGRKKQLDVPNYLKKFVRAHLGDWINSAISALKLEIDVHYVVDVLRSSKNTSRVANIIILDHNTGTDMVNSHWDEGLHQFLQLKHGCRLSLISLKAVFKSNLSYFKQYALLYGLTGTLGSIHDREMLKEMYSVEFVSIPTAKLTKLIQYLPQVYQCTESWISAIVESAYDLSETRSVLLVCEAIKDVSLLQERFKVFLSSKENQRTICSYKRDYELVEASNKKSLTAEPGQIILSTNLAGRGTDIKLSSDLKSAGGLHVCLTFLPTNSRVEEQAYGRVARNGEPGSSQLIIKSVHKASSVSKIIDLKKERGLKENLRITNIKKHYESLVRVEEEYFEKFTKCYENLQKRINSPNEDMKQILLKDCLDEWAFWLDCQSKNLTLDPIDSFLDKLSNYIQIDISSWFQHIKNPSYILQLGLKCLKMKKYELAISMFDQVIKSEPSFSESALYYRPLAKAKLKDIEKDDVICDFELARDLFKKRVDTLLLNSQIVDWLKVHNNKSSLQIDSFNEQQQNIINMYMLLIHSIDQVLGSGVDYQHEINDITNDLINRKVILDHKIKKDPSENDLKCLEEYGITPKEILWFLNKCDGQFNVKSFKKCFALPSKELFWKELINKNILIHEEKYVFVDTNQLEQYGLLLAKIIQTLKLEVEPTNRNHLWIYDLDYINGIESYSMCRKSSLLVKIGSDNYKQFKAKGIFYPNKRATLINTIESVDFKHFNSLSYEDFEKLDICNATAADILGELENNKVIVKTVFAGKIQFRLLLHKVDQINRIELLKCKAYSEDVRSLLRFHFSFGLEMKELLNLLSSNQPLKINLNAKPHSFIVHVLIGNNIIKSVVNPKTSHKSVLEALYRDEMSLDEWGNLFKNIYDEEKKKRILSDLIGSKWLIETNRTTPWIEPRFKLSIKNGKINKTEPISNELQNGSDTIEFILLRYAANSSKMDEYEHFLDAAIGCINKVNTPAFDLKPLGCILMSNKHPVSELSLFTLNGIDQLLQLGEKTWTWKMKRDICIATLFGIAQVAVGSACLCMTLVKTGVDDLIHCVNCMFTGTFHWKDYFIQKVMSLVLLFKAPLLKLFNNSFGNSISLSVSSLKNAGYKFVDACKHLTDKMTWNKEFFASVVSRVVKAVGGCAISNTLNSVMLPKIEHLGKLIVGLFDQSIEGILRSHVVIGSVKQLHDILGEKKAKCVIVEVCSTVGYNYRSSLNNVWNKTFNKIKRIINTARNFLNSNWPSNLQDVEKNLKGLFGLYQMITTLFQKEEYNMIIYPINHFLETLEKHIKKEILTAKQSGTIQEGRRALDNYNVVDFSSDMFVHFKDCVNNEIRSLLNESIIHPLFCIINNKLSLIFMKVTNTTFRKLFSNKEKSHVNKVKCRDFTNQTSEHGKKPKQKLDFVDREYDNYLIQFLKTRKNNAVFAEMLKRNTEIDVSCLTFFCSVIPLVLKKHGINVPNVEITIDRSGVKELYKTKRDKPASLSVIICTNEDILYNIQSNKVLVKGLLKAIVMALLPSNPQVQTVADNFLDKFIMFLESPDSNKQSEANITEHKITTEQKTKLASEYDSYQHSHTDGSWTMNPNMVYHITEEQNKSEMTLIQPLSDYIINNIHSGFTVALSMLNSHIHKVQSHLKLPFKLTLDDFDESQFDIFPPTSSDLNMFHGRAVEYKLIMPFKVTGRKLVNFVLTLRLVNQVREIEPFTPYGPHIVYHVEPLNDPKHMALGFKGHVLLDKRCGTGKITSTDCHKAGNLILPTGFKLITDTRKTIEVLLLGDLELKYVQHYINKPSWEVKVLKNLDFEQYTPSVISNLVQCFKSPKCVIFHLGTSVVQSHLTDKQIADLVSNVVNQIMNHFRGAKAVMFALHQRKFIEEIHNPTILKVNGHFKKYCESMSMIYVETSRFLGPDDLEINGKDLNKRGCKKLAKCFDKLMEKCIK